MIRYMVVVRCDYCGDEEAHATPEAAEAAGWLIDPGADDVCPDCLDEIEEDLERETRRHRDVLECCMRGVPHRSGTTLGEIRECPHHGPGRVVMVNARTEVTDA